MHSAISEPDKDYIPPEDILSVLAVNRYDEDDGAIEQCVRTGLPQLSIYIPTEASIVLGRGSKPEIELRVNACLEDRVPVYKRDGGGCAVVLDPGNIIVSLVLSVGGIRNSRGYFIAITRWLIAALQTVGINGVKREATSDLAIEDRKIGGSSIHLNKNYLYYTTTLLIEPNIESIERYLSYPPREPKYRQGRSHREFLGTLHIGTDTNSFADKLRSCLHLADLIKSLPSQN